MGGMRGAGFSALLGLDDFRKDALATALHVYYINRKYPHAELSLSCPRLRPIVNNDKINPLPVATRSFGGVGIFAIPEMGRFYRHVLIEKNFPHHGAVAFGHYGKALFEVFKYLDVEEVGFNQPKGMLYPSENPFA